MDGLQTTRRPSRVKRQWAPALLHPPDIVVDVFRGRLHVDGGILRIRGRRRTVNLLAHCANPEGPFEPRPRTARRFRRLDCLATREKRRQHGAQDHAPSGPLHHEGSFPAGVVPWKADECHAIESPCSAKAVPSGHRCVLSALGVRLTDYGVEPRQTCVDSQPSLSRHLISGSALPPVAREPSLRRATRSRHVSRER